MSAGRRRAPLPRASLAHSTRTSIRRGLACSALGIRKRQHAVAQAGVDLRGVEIAAQLEAAPEVVGAHLGVDRSERIRLAELERRLDRQAAAVDADREILARHSGQVGEERDAAARPRRCRPAAAAPARCGWSVLESLRLLRLHRRLFGLRLPWWVSLLLKKRRRRSAAARHLDLARLRRFALRHDDLQHAVAVSAPRPAPGSASSGSATTRRKRPAETLVRVDVALLGPCLSAPCRRVPGARRRSRARPFSTETSIVFGSMPGAKA